jgi:hypothetical protein
VGLPPSRVGCEAPATRRRPSPLWRGTQSRSCSFVLGRKGTRQSCLGPGSARLSSAGVIRNRPCKPPPNLGGPLAANATLPPGTPATGQGRGYPVLEAWQRATPHALRGRHRGLRTASTNPPDPPCWAGSEFRPASSDLCGATLPGTRRWAGRARRHGGSLQPSRLRRRLLGDLRRAGASRTLRLCQARRRPAPESARRTERIDGSPDDRCT